MQQRMPALPEPAHSTTVFGTITVQALKHGVLCPDGSGGSRAGSRLARTAWAWTLVDEQGICIAGAQGTTLPPYTVPRAETQAATHAITTCAQLCREHAIVPSLYTDHLNLVKFCNTKPWANTSTRSNHDLLLAFKRALVDTPTAISKV